MSYKKRWVHFHTVSYHITEAKVNSGPIAGYLFAHSVAVGICFNSYIICFSRVIKCTFLTWESWIKKSFKKSTWSTIDISLLFSVVSNICLKRFQSSIIKRKQCFIPPPFFLFLFFEENRDWENHFRQSKKKKRLLTRNQCFNTK